MWGGKKQEKMRREKKINQRGNTIDTTRERHGRHKVLNHNPPLGPPLQTDSSKGEKRQTKGEEGWVHNPQGAPPRTMEEAIRRSTNYSLEGSEQ